MVAQRTEEIRHYHLYGEAGADVELDFVHIEPIRRRSSANDWTISAHSHPDHLQLLHVREGGGTITIEDRDHPVGPHSVVVVPVGFVHAMALDPGTDGHVVTAARAYALGRTEGQPRFQSLLDGPAVHGPVDAGTGRRIGECLADMQAEYVRTMPGRRMAITAQFDRMLVLLLRSLPAGAAAAGAPDRDLELVRRYREALETSFRTEKRLSFYADRLGVSPQRLNLACKARTGKTASTVMHERIVIEAKRSLVYRPVSVAEIGYELGFEDPAYFSRFFASKAGMSPGRYRDAQHRRARGGSDAE